jgi:L-ribulose-5-phosphate 3-epimerase
LSRNLKDINCARKIKIANMKTSIKDRLAVCTWSLQPAGLSQLLDQMRQIGIPRAQIAMDPIREHPENWDNLSRGNTPPGIDLVSGMFGCAGEDYSTMESIRRTGGIVPDATWEQNWQNIRMTAELAVRMSLRLVGFHAGFLPHDVSDPDFAKLLDRLRQVADVFAERGIDLALETGQEEAETLRDFLEKLDRRNVGVNFDPANMILYDKGDPINALRVLGPWLKQCHLKDAKRTRTPGEWGDEVVVGTGEVNWREFFQVLDQQNFSGYCCIEREAGTERMHDIRAAREFVEKLGV